MPAAAVHATPSDRSAGRRADALRLAGALSLSAGFIHLVAAPEHLTEWWGYGLFFLLASMAQLYWGLATLAVLAPQPLADEARPAGGNEGFFLLGMARRQWYRAAVAGNLAIVALYVVTRTVGIPLLGPAAGEVEPVTALGVASKASELALVGTLAWLLRHPLSSAPSATVEAARQSS